MLETGLHASISFSVSPADTAAEIGSGTLPVLATPRLAAAMEEAAWRAVAPHLPDGSTTVGTQLTLSHLAPTPLQGEVRCQAVLEKTEGRILSFSLSARDSAGLIAEGSHQRAIVEADRFLEKARVRGGQADA